MEISLKIQDPYLPAEIVALVPLSVLPPTLPLPPVLETQGKKSPG